MRNFGKVINNKDIATKEYVDNHGGESLPVGSEIDYDGNDIPTGWEEADDPNTYSTTEKRVGTWIDGKPIYRKVYTATDSSGFTNDINVPIGFTTWDEVVTLRGIITTKSNEIFPLPSINYSGTSIYGRQLEIISKAGSWQPNTFYIVNRNISTDDNKTKKYVIVFEYTKTTD